MPQNDRLRGSDLRILFCILLSGLLGTCSAPPSLLEQVRSLGELRVVTRQSPTTYYQGPDGPTGPEYDLVKGFADQLGVKLVIIPVVSISEIMPHLISGDAQMAAAGLSITPARLKYARFSQPYSQVDTLLVYKLGRGRPRAIEDIIGSDIEIIAGSSHAETMAAIKKGYPDLQWHENADVEVSDMLDKVATGEIDYTTADSTDFNIHRHFHPDLRVALDLEIADQIAWAFKKDIGDSLLAEADNYLIESKRNGLLAQVRERYYGHVDRFDYVGTRSFIRHVDSRLPRFKEMFEEAQDTSGVDWRLLAAIGYQESHWRAKAVSPTGVRGIMMLTEATADYLGLADRLDPKSSIDGGARFFARQMERIPDAVPEPDRTWMALAAYNVGYNHLRDAMKIVRLQGGDPNRWVDVSEALPLLAQHKWYSKMKYGYARGWEPVLYVKNIRSYFDILLWMIDNEEEPEESIDEPIPPSEITTAATIALTAPQMLY